MVEVPSGSPSSNIDDGAAVIAIPVKELASAPAAVPPLAAEAATAEDPEVAASLAASASRERKDFNRQRGWPRHPPVTGGVVALLCELPTGVLTTDNDSSCSRSGLVGGAEGALGGRGGRFGGTLLFALSGRCIWTPDEVPGRAVVRDGGG